MPVDYIYSAGERENAIAGPGIQIDLVGPLGMKIKIDFLENGEPETVPVPIIDVFEPPHLDVPHEIRQGAFQPVGQIMNGGGQVPLLPVTETVDRKRQRRCVVHDGNEVVYDGIVL